MAKKGKVGTSGREIMAALWGSRGRPETNQYAELCAERQQERDVDAKFDRAYKNIKASHSK